MGKRYFTLIELLFVVLLLMVVVSMTMPAIARVRDKASQVQCISSLKTLGIAFYMYSSDNRGLLPHEDRVGGGEAPFGSCLYDVIPEYINGRRVAENESSLYCSDTITSSEKVFNEDAPIIYSYKMNSRLEDYNGSSVFRNISSIRSPSTTVLIFDGRIDTSYYQSRSFGMHTSVYQRHSAGAGILFADTHVTMAENKNNTNGHWQDKGGLRWDPADEL